MLKEGQAGNAGAMPGTNDSRTGYVQHLQELSNFQREHVVASTPSPLDFFAYVFALGNLLAGPYFEYTEWLDFVDSKGVRAKLQAASTARYLSTES